MNPAPFVVAIVDDNHSLRDAIGSLLRSEGHAVEFFGSAEEFLQRPSPAAVQCLILDVRLPGMSGLDLLRLLVTSGSGIPTICITAQKDPDGRIREHALRAGARILLYKPFDSEELLTAVRSIRDGGRQHP